MFITGILENKKKYKQKVKLRHNPQTGIPVSLSTEEAEWPDAPHSAALGRPAGPGLVPRQNRSLRAGPRPAQLAQFA